MTGLSPTFKRPGRSNSPFRDPLVIWNRSPICGDRDSGFFGLAASSDEEVNVSPANPTADETTLRLVGPLVIGPLPW